MMGSSERVMGKRKRRAREKGAAGTTTRGGVKEVVALLWVRSTAGGSTQAKALVTPGAAASRT